MKTNNDRKNFIWNMVGLTFNAFNSLFFLVAVRLFNGTDTAGTFSYAFSLCALLYVVATFYTRTYQIANYNNTKNIQDFFTFRLLSSIFCFLIAVGFCLINQFDFSKTLIILLILGFRIVEAISDCIYGYIQEHERLYNVGISLFLKAVFGLIAFLITDAITQDLSLAILSVIFINLLFLFFYDWKIFKKISKNLSLKLRFSNLKLIFFESISIFAFTFLLIYMANLQKYVLTYSASGEIQMIFGILIMPSTMLSLAGNYLIMPFLTKLNRSIKNKHFEIFQKDARKILLAMLAIGVFITIIAYFAGIPVLSLIYQFDLSKYHLELIIVIIASIISAITIMLSNFLVLLGKNKMQLLFYFIASAFATGISITLIFSQGIFGAVLAYLISYIILFIMYMSYYIISLKRLKR
ncbi:hypothetical protein IJ798_01380 [Candidatus Saccharibacteria bacterium]|nr:hypothetical protein [Candidatus Saccharibacteria bacterium]